jgi:hypothetical protein
MKIPEKTLAPIEETGRAFQRWLEVNSNATDVRKLQAHALIVMARRKPQFGVHVNLRELLNG